MKTIRPGPRPFVAFGIISLLLLVIALPASVKTGDWRIIFCLLLFPVLICTAIAFSTIEYDQTEIRRKNFGIVSQRARFEDIGVSSINVLAEKDWPGSITIFGKQEDLVLMTVGLKIWSKRDVKWLLAQPELKLQNPAED